MVKRRSFAALAVMVNLMASVASAPASAQSGWVRTDLWGAVQAGYGWASWSCSTCAPARAKASWAGGYRIGGTISPHVLLAGDFNLWGLSTPSHSVGKVADHVCGLAAEVFFYPRASGRFFLSGGGGFTAVGDDSVGTLGIGPAVVAGLGYDAGIAWRPVADDRITLISVTPVAKLYYGSLSTLTNPRTGAVQAHHWKQHILELGLAITAQDRRPE